MHGAPPFAPVDQVDSRLHDARINKTSTAPIEASLGHWVEIEDDRYDRS
jgi:hypothetical protein